MRLETKRCVALFDAKSEERDRGLKRSKADRSASRWNSRGSIDRFNDRFRLVACLLLVTRVSSSRSAR